MILGSHRGEKSALQSSRDLSADEEPEASRMKRNSDI